MNRRKVSAFEYCSRQEQAYLSENGLLATPTLRSVHSESFLEQEGHEQKLTAFQLLEEERHRRGDERDTIQKKTFTKWVNKHLSKSGKKIDDLFEGLRDGFNLITLLEALSGETLPKENGFTRFHRIQNVQYVLDFLKAHNIRTVNIRPEDIVGGNPKLTLGLIWTIILNYQVSVIKLRQQQHALARAAALGNSAPATNASGAVIEASSSSAFYSSTSGSTKTTVSKSVVQRAPPAAFAVFMTNGHNAIMATSCAALCHDCYACIAILILPAALRLFWTLTFQRETTCVVSFLFRKSLALLLPFRRVGIIKPRAALLCHLFTSINISPVPDVLMGFLWP
uniref:Calponin-homology (CH) domain-containing protein n=1 Tax=Panagrellus redivivus TaxID=6233 RepID=A0A7E4VC58_PANRE